MKLVLIGIQGAGKSTQGNLLSAKLKIPYLSTGHIFRQMAKEKTPIGRYIKEVMTSGVLIPDKKTLEIVEAYLSKPEYQSGYVLDGFPRTLKQAKMFKNGIDFVIYLNVSDKEALWRISGRTDTREDETLQAIRKRIESFHKFTVPVIDYYRSQGKLLEINGEQPIDAIFNQIKSHLNGNQPISHI